MTSVGIAILTLNGEIELRQLLSRLTVEEGADRVVVVDSESTDGTQACVAAYPFVEFLQISRADFNHGATREMARKHLKTDIVVFLTQDVIPRAGFLKTLVQPIAEGEVAATYSRQLPHEGASFFEAFPRYYNYPATGHRRTIDDVTKYGVFTFFCSDSCAAYSNAALDSIGGIAPILTNEDYFAVAKLLSAGYAIEYVADSQVHHSHTYTLSAEFRRYFDTGYVRGEFPWVSELAGQAEGHGSGFLKAMLLELIRKKPLLLPFAVAQTAVKWFGYRIGFLGPKLPKSWCRAMSSQRYFWDSKYCNRP